MVLISTSVHATDFNTVLTGQNDKPAIECLRLSVDKQKCDEEITVTLGWLVRIALDLPEERMKTSDIINRGMLSEKIKTNPNIDLSVEEAKLAKDQVAKLNYRVNIRFQAIKLIDPKGIQ
jgi:hypothetical protein